MSGIDKTKKVLITGTSSGIGLALAKHYLSEGTQVTGIDKKSGELSNNQAFTSIVADLSDITSIEAVVKNLKNENPCSFDIIVLNAGINYTGKFADQDLERQLSLLDLNLTSPIQTSREILANGLIRENGSFVFISSLSKFTSYPGASVYAASKEGLSSWASSLRVSLKEQAINVLTVYPGPTDTPHAAEHSPDNSKSSSRFDPNRLAVMIDRAVVAKKRKLVPGLGNKIIASLGQNFPTVSEKIMDKILFQKMRE